MANVVTIVRFTSMPISAAVLLSSETARMAVPIFERMTKKYRPAIIAIAAPITRTSTHWMSRNGMGTSPSRKSIVG